MVILNAVPRCQASSLEMALWWWTNFFISKAYLDRMHLTQQLKFRRRDWYQYGGVKRQRYLIHRNWNFETKYLYRSVEFKPFITRKLKFWSRGITPVDLWSSLFLFNAVFYKMIIMQIIHGKNLIY